jgi:hypothetical protein
MLSRAAFSSEVRSGKYRYAVASDTSADLATSGIVTGAPLRMISRQASMIATRVRIFWLARPASLSVFMVHLRAFHASGLSS